MDLRKFSKKLSDKLNNCPEHLTDEQIKECHMNYIEYHTKKKPDEILVIPIEEMAELTQHLSKVIRGKETSKSIGLLEELVDVQICIDNLKINFGIDEETFKYAMDVKLERSSEKIKNETA